MRPASPLRSSDVRQGIRRARIVQLRVLLSRVPGFGCHDHLEVDEDGDAVGVAAFGDELGPDSITRLAGLAQIGGADTHHVRLRRTQIE